MIYLTGDTHGNIRRLLEADLAPGDSLIVLGDFGVGMRPGFEEELDAMARLKYQILFVDGNHEAYPLLEALPKTRWNGGSIHLWRPNVLHLMRGQVYTLEGKTLFTMGGGFSMDRATRIKGKTWWPQEMPSPEEYAEALENLQRVDHLHGVLTHAAPSAAMMCMGYLSAPNQHERPLISFLDKVYHSVPFDRWYFGHLHADHAMGRLIACYKEIHPWEE